MTTPIKIYNSSLVEQGTIDEVIDCARTEKINSDNILNFTVELDTAMTALINDTNVVGLGTDYFDIAKYTKKQNGGNLPIVDVECEHVSYRLNNPTYDEDYFTETGTPTEVLTAILDGTDFSVGTVDFVDNVTYSAQQKMSRRQILMEFVATLEGEIECLGFTIGIRTARGSVVAKDLTANNNLTLLSKTVDKRTLDSLGNPTTSYECALYDPVEALSLGDVVTLEYTLLDMDIDLRIVSLTTNPYDDLDVAFEVSNYVNALEDDLYRIETEKVGVDKYYNKCRIGPTYGFEAVLSDLMARAYFCATAMAMQKGDGLGSWTDVLYFDPVEGTYKFTGSLSITLSDNMARVLFNEDGFTMQKGDGTGSNWIDVLYFDAETGTFRFDGTVMLDSLSGLDLTNPIIRLFSHRGTAQAGTDGTITLAETASTTDDIYNGMDIVIAGGTGEGQTRTIIDYSGSVRIAYTDENWTTNPDDTSTYEVRGPAIDATANNEQGVGDALRFKWNRFNYLRVTTDRADFYFTSLDSSTIPNIRPDGFYIGNTKIAGVTEAGGSTPYFADSGIENLFVQDSEPATAQESDVWVDTDDYSRYDKTAITGTTTLNASDNEFLTVSGTFTLTLHTGTSAGIIKKIYNIGTGIVTIAGTINGVANMYLYPNESVELITDGTNWRY